MSNETKWTPGPWAFFGPTDLEPSTVAVGGRGGMVSIYTAPLTRETEANARLIAAAPDMLEALRGLLADGITADDLMLLFLMGGVTGEQQEKFRPVVERLRNAQHVARAAISKAEGREPAPSPAPKRPRRKHSRSGQVRCEICGPLRCVRAP